MNINFNAVAIVGKSITVKVEKDEKKDELRICHLKVERMQVSRDVIDALLGCVEGWAARCLFDDGGTPVAWLTLELEGARFDFTGSIVGSENKGERLMIGAACTLSGVTLRLHALGALLSGELSWPAAGDELADVDPLLGKVCMVRGAILKPEPAELFERPRAQAERDQLAANHLAANERLESSLVAAFHRTTRPLKTEGSVTLRSGESVTHSRVETAE